MSTTDDGITRPDPNRNAAAGQLPAPIRVTLDRTSSPFTKDERLWEVIKDRTSAVSFANYKAFIDAIDAQGSIFRGVEAYQALKVATRAWLQHEAGVWMGTDDDAEDDVRVLVNKTLRRDLKKTPLPGPDTADQAEIDLLHDEYLVTLRQNFVSDLENDLKVLPYHKLIVDALGGLPAKPLASVQFGEYGISPSSLFRPVLLELIWSYWHEEGMLVQSMNAISRRFQNRRGTVGTGEDPLFRMEIDPLRAVNNLVWGYVQDEWNLLTVQRRAYEYQHEYGISLLGKAIPSFAPADSRSRFLTAFHDLLLTAAAFYEADDDTTVVADAFPVLNALKDVHAILAEGAHNQFGDLVWTARSEMLIQEWILSRPEFREFLGGRTMVPYREPWMDRVDTMRQIMGWGDASVTHFRDLGFFGERLLLSVRYGNWSAENDAANAENWARWWRTEIKTYMHSYRAVTGVDLTGQAQPVLEVARDGRYEQPSVLLRRRLDRRHRTPAGITSGPHVRGALPQGGDGSASANGAGRPAAQPASSPSAARPIGA
jgi:hypothetical protein